MIEQKSEDNHMYFKNFTEKFAGDGTAAILKAYNTWQFRPMYPDIPKEEEEYTHLENRFGVAKCAQIINEYMYEDVLLRKSFK